MDAKNLAIQCVQNHPAHFPTPCVTEPLPSRGATSQGNSWEDFFVGHLVRHCRGRCTYTYTVGTCNQYESERRLPSSNNTSFFFTTVPTSGAKVTTAPDLTAADTENKLSLSVGTYRTSVRVTLPVVFYNCTVP